jgi:hypothetical protein
MIRNIIILLALLILTFSAKGQELREIKRTNDKQFRTSGDDLLITMTDDERGLVLGDYSIANDSGRLSLLYHVNADLKDATKVSTFEFNYAKKFDLAWLEFFVARSTINFSQMAKYNATVLRGASLDDILAEDEGILSLGAGLSYRTRYIQDLLGFDTWFESVGASLAYYQMDENFTEEKFSGLGIKADFGIHKRTSKNFHIGGKMSYNLAPVKRSADGDEPSSDRALLLRWLSFAVDLSYYF